MHVATPSPAKLRRVREDNIRLYYLCNWFWTGGNPPGPPPANWPPVPLKGRKPFDIPLRKAVMTMGDKDGTEPTGR